MISSRRTHTPTPPDKRVSERKEREVLLLFLRPFTCCSDSVTHTHSLTHPRLSHKTEWSCTRNQKLLNSHSLPKHWLLQPLPERTRLRERLRQEGASEEIKRQASE